MAPLAQKDIPRVKELCDLLGFGTPLAGPHHILTDSTHSWRRRYLTDSGIPGKDLKEWKSPQTQTDLEQMARKFLEDGGYGQRLWPMGSIFMKLRYPDNRERY